MRLELSQRVAGLNHRYRSHDPAALVDATLADPDTGRVALVSSFGAESVVLLHMVATVAPQTPVLFVDTLMLFEETLAYQREVADQLGLRDVRVIRASKTDLAAQDPDGTLHETNPDACCALRKTAPLEAALAEFDGWLTGRKRYQGQTRADLDHFEVETATRMKINPLAHWGRTEIAAYMDRYDLPRHPLVARGYPSIGCAPCTSPVAAGEDPRAGRWRGQEKTECGIHFVNGRIVRPGNSEKVA
ncbi:phosphoadenosine phosphosulfate reductase [Rhodobacter sp. TJ_12]|uniref:phosphoadenylyl-sulfate reductase n=1 Tax=Rhodobacter sp. TJ_12 TaxID=2029399 RepID=UPI001CBE0BFB|nr:phosphoadenylyl-sulfate reductase [Rhodobacter sp. TJ_12]MBZ4022233.1 phosphoadenosine phosphosulfate reductase [Rhodobacter sp. TJ_12]